MTLAAEPGGTMDGATPTEESAADRDARVLAEEHRTSEGSLREDAERNRGVAEARRERAETRRKDAERDRDRSERQREHAERAREAAEGARQAAEAARDETAALRTAFDEQLAIMREMRETLRALEARLAQSTPEQPRGARATR